MRIGYGIVTVNRPGGFIHEMIESLSQTGFFSDPANLPLNLCVGNVDSSYLTRYRANPAAFRVMEMSPLDVARYKFDTISRGARCSLGHFFCMKEMLAMGVYDALAVFEDDLHFAKGWQQRMRRAMDSVTAQRKLDWIMALYSPEYDVTIQHNLGNIWFDLTKPKFFGSQGILYPTQIAKEVLPLVEAAVIGGKIATDMVVSEYVRNVRPEVSLVAVTPCLVQHIGNISVGCNPEAVYFHKAGCFMDSIVNP